MTDKIAIIGSGMMGTAIVKSLVKANYAGKIFAADFQDEKLKGVEALGVPVTADNRKASAKADIIFVCVKPVDVEKVLQEINKEIKDKILISIAATLPVAYLKKMIPEAKIVRAMPNIAVSVQAAYTAFCCDNDVTSEDKKRVKAILNTMGISEEISEKYMDVITGLSGSGPGYLSIIAEAMVYAGLKMGLPREIAAKASAQTLLGTAKLMLEANETPAKIRDMVTTPGGTTIEAIYAIEGSQIRKAMFDAVEAAAKKSTEIREKITSGTR
jgi:pyrroline-5-carboxylate reductase